MKNLRQYIKSILLEAMIQPSDVESKFAIWTDLEDTGEKPSSYTDINFVMYDVEEAKKIFSEEQENSSGADEVANIQYAIDQSIKAVVRVITPSTGTCNGAWEVTRSAAIDNLGPTLYDLVMAISPGLMADRESVSKDARKVWKFYANNRSDVYKKFLDPKGFNVTSFEEDDCQTHGQRIHHIAQASTKIAKAWLDDYVPELHKLWKDELDSIGFPMHFNSGEDYFGRMMYFLKRIGKSEKVDEIDHDGFQEFYEEEQWRNLFDYNEEEIGDIESLNISYESGRESNADVFYGMQDNHAEYLEYTLNNKHWTERAIIAGDVDMAIDYLDQEIDSSLINFFNKHYR